MDQRDKDRLKDVSASIGLSAYLAAPISYTLLPQVLKGVDPALHHSVVGTTVLAGTALAGPKMAAALRRWRFGRRPNQRVRAPEAERSGPGIERQPHPSSAVGIGNDMPTSADPTGDWMTELVRHGMPTVPGMLSGDPDWNLELFTLQTPSAEHSSSELRIAWSGRDGLGRNDIHVDTRTGEIDSRRSIRWGDGPFPGDNVLIRDGLRKELPVAYEVVASVAHAERRARMGSRRDRARSQLASMTGRMRGTASRLRGAAQRGRDDS
jgi:hypothetical protein